jgi:3-methyladenine DNA glycosylase AlkD
MASKKTLNTTKNKKQIAVAKKKASPPSIDLSATQFVKGLELHRPASVAGKDYVKTDKDGYDKNDLFMGVRMGQVFALAKEFMAMPPGEISKLLDSPVHEARVGAVSIMDFQARDKKTPESRRKELFNLYVKRHDRINSWGMVDRAAPYVVGGYLSDKPRDILYKLARSRKIWERRTAIVSTYFFIRQNDVADTFKIAEMLVHDQEHFIHTAVGGWVREAGKKDPRRLLQFLDKHAATMPRTTLRFATEKLDKKLRDRYLGMNS